MRGRADGISGGGMLQDTVDWAAVRAVFEGGDQSRNAICASHGIELAELEERARKNKWDRSARSLAAEREFLLDSLFYAFERLARHIGEQSLSESGEKEAAVLHRLTVTLDRLMHIDGRAAGKQPSPRQSREMTELRAKIGKRLDELKIR